MSKFRVYELAKELGVENKDVINKAKELGLTTIRSHSNSLDGDEADTIRRAFIREAIGSNPDTEVVKTRLDSSTGATSSVVERRKGDVVRRRKSNEPVVPEVVKKPIDDVESDIFGDPHSGPADIEVKTRADHFADAENLFKAETPETRPTNVETVEVPEIVEDVEPEVVEVVAGAAAEVTADKASVGGPRVLGRMELPQAKKKIEKVVKPRFTAATVVVDEDEDDDRPKGAAKGKRTRRKELSIGDLVDYQGKSARKGGRSRGKGRSDYDGDDFQVKHGTEEMKASKKVVRMTSDAILVGELASQMSVKAGEVIKKLISLGVMATINQAIDQDTATIVADEFGYTLEFTGFDEGDILKIDEASDASTLQPRPPVVTVMGHVDHGKTSLLDYIRSASVASREHGGITQHIGAYHVKTANGKQISFVDTPGHAAFTEMRARGAKVTDIVILVVAADDGVMPQTVEALNHAKAAEVPVVVAMNKMDKNGANPERIKQQLAEHGLLPEDWGGDTMYYPVSALTGAGVPELLEGLLLLAEMKELKANPDCRVKGTVIESRQEIGRGTVATILVQSGTLRVGDVFVAGAEFGRVRSMVDYTGAKLDAAPPSMPVEITGLNGVPSAGDEFIVVEDESKAKDVTSRRKELVRQRDALALAGGPISLEEFARMAQTVEAAELRLVIKADVHGSLEAVASAVNALSRETVKVKVIHGAIGGVSESDVQLAIASKALIIGFGVRGEPRALAEAESRGVETRFYRVIYELIDDVKKAMAGLLAPIRKEVSLGRAEVRETFSVPKIGVVAGCYIVDGSIRRGAILRLLRDSRVVYEGKLLNLRRFKDDVREVQTGYECGISIEGYNDIQTGDVIEAFEIKEEAATLE